MKQTAIINSEIKARCTDQEAVRHYLREHGADFKGTDHQIDTYFHVPKGRLKLRQGGRSKITLSFISGPILTGRSNRPSTYHPWRRTQILARC